MVKSVLQSKLLPNQKIAIKKIDELIYSKDENTSSVAILALPWGSGKTLIAEETIRKLGSKEPILVITPLTVSREWIIDSKKHFNPPLNIMLFGSKSRCKKLHNTSWYQLKSKYDIIIINYDMISQAHTQVCNARTKIIKEEIFRLDTFYPSTTDTTYLSNQEKNMFLEKRKRRNELNELLEKHIISPDVSKSLPFPELCKKEEINICTAGLDIFYYNNWPLLVIDEVHEARTRGSTRFNAINQLKSQKKLFISATIVNNSIEDLKSLFILSKISPEGGWTCEKTNSSLSAHYLSEYFKKYVILDDQKIMKQHYRSIDVIVREEFQTNDEKKCYQFISSYWKHNHSNDESNSSLILSNTIASTSLLINDSDNNNNSSSSSSSSSTNNNNDNNNNSSSSNNNNNNNNNSSSSNNNNNNNNDIDNIIKKTKSPSNILEAICKMRQACNGIYDKNHIQSINSNFTDKNNKYIFNFPSKINMVLKYLECVVERCDKAVGFVGFKHTLEGLVYHTKKKFKHKINVFFINGQTSLKQRDLIIKQFTRTRKSSVLFATLRTINLGTNLWAANHTLHIDVWWNPVPDKQAEARVERPQQTKSVFHAYFIIKGTVEDSMWLVAQAKQDIINGVMSGNIKDTMLESITSKSALNDALLKANDRNILSPVLNGDNKTLLVTLGKKKYESSDTKQMKFNCAIELEMKNRCNILLESNKIVKLLPKTKSINNLVSADISNDKTKYINNSSSSLSSSNINNNNNNNNRITITRKRTIKTIISNSKSSFLLNSKSRINIRKKKSTPSKQTQRTTILLNHEPNNFSIKYVNNNNNNNDSNWNDTPSYKKRKRVEIIGKTIDNSISIFDTNTTQKKRICAKYYK